ncbi:MAG: hypothetical protein ABJE47_10790 [bacterium]
MRSFLHPTWATHVAYADRGATRAASRTYAEHLMACTDCRATHAALKAMLSSASALPLTAPPPTAWSTITARLDAGDRVLLPASHLPRTRPIPTARVAAFVAAAAAIVIALSWPSTRTIYAARSELRVTPRPGSRMVDLRYANPMLCSGCSTLVVRARWRGADDERSSDEMPVVSAGTLHRDGDALVGSIRLPDDALVGFVSLESPDAGWTDNNDGRAWTVETADAGIRSLAVRRAIIRDLSDRDWEGALKLNRALAAAFPDSVTAWTDLVDRERRLSHDTASMARDRATLNRLDALSRGRMDSTGETAARMFRLAWSVLDATITRDTTALPQPMRYWLGEMHRSRMTSPLAMHVRLLVELQAMYDRPHDALTRLEQRWHEDSSEYLLVSEGIRTARRGNDTLAAARWWRRLSQLRPSAARPVATQLSQLAPSRTEGIALLRRFIADSGAADNWRALGVSHEEFRHEQRDRVARANMALSSALFANGDSVGGERALASAAAASWNTAALQTLSARLLARGDTLRALQSLAILSADPSRTPAFMDTVRLKTKRTYSDAAVTRWRDSGTVLLRAHLLGQLQPVTLVGPLTTLRTENGADVAMAARKDPVLISFWSAGCAPSLEELPDLANALPSVTSRGLSVVVVSRAKRGATGPKETLPFVVDADGTLHRAVKQWMTPERFLVMPGASHRVWRVALPVAELPLLAAAIQAGLVSSAVMP